MSATGILPSYQRFVNGVPVPSFSRRSFRPREKYLICLVFLTFGIVCFGTLFFLPELRNSNTAVDSVYQVYKTMQKAGPELLIPAPPHLNQGDALKLMRHDDSYHGEDPHLLDDRAKFHAKLEEDPSLKVLERPDVGPTHNENALPVDMFPKAEPDNLLVDNRSITSADYLPITDKGEDKDPVARMRRDKVKEMMKHAWDNYVRYAWGKNELRPVSKRGHSASIFGNLNMGATIVDGLDTLYIMGMQEEFKQGREWIAEFLEIDNLSSDISVFETNIRFVGGLLSCYALTGDVVFRDKAQQIADKLLPAFQTPTGIPYALINMKTGLSKNYAWASAGSSILSEFGTLHLEFAYLSDVTGNSIYRNKVDNIRQIINTMEKPKGLYPNYLNPKTGKWGQQHISIGALGDSFYEYLLKAWIQSGRSDMQARTMYDEAMEKILEHMLKKSTSGMMYFAELKYDRLEHKMDHLGCFMGGLLALGAHTYQNSMADRYNEVAAGITHTCHESYDRTELKLGPESFRFTDTIEARAVKNTEKYYILRPEVIESYFIMWRLTKDQKYRDWGWEAVLALERHCRVAGGFTGVKNVYKLDSQQDDVQQSFFLAETLKYLYLLFSDDSLISLDEWVFNTEAHPLPIKGVNALYREKQDYSTQ